MKTASDDVIRGKILYYLSLIYPQQATLSLLRGELDIFGYRILMAELNRYIAYLEDKGFVSIRAILQGGRPITLIKVTATGIDYLDGRLPADAGIYLEPRI